MRTHRAELQRGRPRSERSRVAALDATRLLLTRHGMDHLTIEGIAAEAGVSKATIYRWWPGKAAIVLDAVIDQVDSAITFPEPGDPRAELEAEIRSVIHLYTSTDTGGAILDLVAASRGDADLAEAMRETFFVRRRAVALHYLEQCAAQGLLRAGMDAEIVVDAVWGALYYRLLVAHLPLTPDYAGRLLDEFWPALRAAPDRSRDH